MSGFYKFDAAAKWKSDFIKSLFWTEKVNTENWVFRIHYKLSLRLIFLFSLCFAYVRTKMPISCYGAMIGTEAPDGRKSKYGMGAFRKEAADFCWAQGVFVVTNADPAREMYPGVVAIAREQDKIYVHSYYKWMSLYLLLMHIILITPKYLWRCIESGTMSALLKDVTNIKPITERGDSEKASQEKVVSFLYRHMGHFSDYALGYVLCEILNLAATVVLLVMWDIISDHELSRTGGSFYNLKTSRNIRTDPMAAVFPVVGKCIFNIHGFSGNKEPHEYICTLPMNSAAERAAITFWYYFLVVLIIDIGSLVLRLMAIMVQPVRTRLLGEMATIVSRKNIRALSKKCSYSDWFFIRQVGACIEPTVFREILEKLIEKLDLGV